MMTLGIFVYSHYHSFSYLYEGVKNGNFFTPSVMCVFLGFILMVISSFGFFGGLKQSTCMVNAVRRLSFLYVFKAGVGG
jgi:hypothetical protein